MGSYAPSHAGSNGPAPPQSVYNQDGSYPQSQMVSMMMNLSMSGYSQPHQPRQYNTMPGPSEPTWYQPPMVPTTSAPPMQQQTMQPQTIQQPAMAPTMHQPTMQQQAIQQQRPPPSQVGPSLAQAMPGQYPIAPGAMQQLYGPPAPTTIPQGPPPGYMWPQQVSTFPQPGFQPVISAPATQNAMPAYAPTSAYPQPQNVSHPQMFPQSGMLPVTHAPTPQHFAAPGSVQVHQGPPPMPTYPPPSHVYSTPTHVNPPSASAHRSSIPPHPFFLHPPARSSGKAAASTRYSPSKKLHEDQPLMYNVYADECEEKINELASLVQEYPVVCVDTEFPGTVYPLPDASHFPTNVDLVYTHMYNNVMATSPIQIGFTLFNYDGERPPGTSSFQFNLKFNRNTDTQNIDSINMLERQGSDFARLITDGIDPHYFGKLLGISALAANENIVWVIYHGAYDVAYLLKCLRYYDPSPLPIRYSDYERLLGFYFPYIIDAKYMSYARYKTVGAGLRRLSMSLGLRADCEKLNQHQSGADSLLTGLVLFRMVEGLDATQGEGAREDMFSRCFNRLYGFAAPTVDCALRQLRGYLIGLITFPTQTELLKHMPMQGPNGPVYPLSNDEMNYVGPKGETYRDFQKQP